MKYLDLSGLEHLIGRLIQWRSTDWTINVTDTIATVAAPSVADNDEFRSKIAAGDSVTLVFSNGDPTRKAYVISVDSRQVVLVGGTTARLIQYSLTPRNRSILFKRLDIPNAADVSSKLTASGTTEDLTVDEEGNLGLTYSDGFIEKLCKDLGKTDVAKDALKDNALLGAALGNNIELGEALATGNPSFVSALTSSSSFVERLATGGLATNNYFGTALALNNSAFATALPQNSAFTFHLAVDSSFQSSLANHPDFIGRFIYSSAFSGQLNSGTAFYPLLENQAWINALKSALSR